MTLPRPYYSDDAVTIYHGDCRELLPLMPLVDLVLTDPPYGMNYVSGHYVGANQFGGIVGDCEWPADVIAQCFDLARCGVIAFGPRVMPLNPSSLIVWVKNNWTAGDLDHAYARQWESIGFWPGPEHQWANGRPADVIESPREAHTSRNVDLLWHPTRKPVGLVSKLLQHHKGDLTLDPFMGSGTTLRAAKDLGRKAIGIEIEERYCEIAAKRMSQTVFAL